MQTALVEPHTHLCTYLAHLDDTPSGEEVVGPPLENSQAGTVSVWQPLDALKKREFGDVPQLLQAHTRDVSRRGGTTHTETS